MLNPSRKARVSVKTLVSAEVSDYNSKSSGAMIQVELSMYALSNLRTYKRAIVVLNRLPVLCEWKVLI